MSPPVRYIMGTAGLVGTLVFGLIFVLFHDTEPFGLVPPVVEAVLLSLVIVPLLYLSIAMRTRFDQEGYVRTRGRVGILSDISRMLLACAMLGIAIGLLSAFLFESTNLRIVLIGIIEYFTAFWVFSLANAAHYDDQHIRKAFGR